jgi:hypothetical protein
MRAAAVLTVSLLVAGCAFRPDGGLAGGEDDAGVTSDAAEESVDAAVAIDAGLNDAAHVDARPPFDVDDCPDSYRGILNTSSRWRVIEPESWGDAAATCAEHEPGATHLAVFSGQGERDAVGAALFFGNEHRRLWIGVWHTGTTIRTVTGEPLYPNVSMAPGQAVSWIRSLTDPFDVEAATSPYAALCECDGRPSQP